MSKKCKKRTCCRPRCTTRRTAVNNTGCSTFGNFNACTTIPALLILQQSGLLCNDRAYILILLALCCGGFGACNTTAAC